MPLASRRTATAADYVDSSPAEDVADAEFLDPDDPDYDSGNTNSLASGWEAALNATKAAAKRYTDEFKFTEEPQLIKFLTNEPFAVYDQHWIERQGKRSFFCLASNGSEEACPLCAKGDTPSPKVAFTVINLSADEPTREMLVTSPTLTNLLAGLDADPKTGPLDRLYWSMSRKGSGRRLSYSIVPVKPRDLDEDWGADPTEIEAVIDRFEPLTDKVISRTPRAELVEIAREINRA